MSRVNPAPPFWRCSDCGTPNPNAGYVTNCLGCGAHKPAQPNLAEKPGSKPKSAGIFTKKVRPPKPSASNIPRWRVWLGRLALITTWFYVIAVAALILIIATLGERWWPTTFLLFAPRWAALFPLPPLVVLAVIARRRSATWPLIAASLLTLGPWMGLCIPWQALIQRGEPGVLNLRVATCNIEGGRALGLPDFIEAMNPHILVMQECPPDGLKNKPQLERAGYMVHYENGIGIASKFPILAVEYRALAVPAWAGGMAVRFTLQTPAGRINVFGVHLETPREGLEAVLADKLAGVPTLTENMTQRWKESRDAAQWAAESTVPYLIIGDFNMPHDSPIYRRHWSSFVNAFATSGIGYGHSKFTRLFGIRIDHILGGPGWIARRAKVGPYVGSDHRPVISDLEWSPSE